VIASDAELLRAVGEGDEPAFEELHRRYRRAVERSCRKLVGPELEDCTQEVFLRIWRKAELFDRRRGSAPVWLMTLARRTAINFLHTRRRASVVELPEDVLPVESLALDRLWLDDALATLPERERSVLELAYFDDLSQSQIAAKLAVPLGSVKSWTRRGLNRLATRIGEESP
jgi:RNA polymerase sigma-70 factor, ECF subfamily